MRPCICICGRAVNERFALPDGKPRCAFHIGVAVMADTVRLLLWAGDSGLFGMQAQAWRLLDGLALMLVEDCREQADWRRRLNEEVAEAEAAARDAYNEGYEDGRDGQ